MAKLVFRPADDVGDFIKVEDFLETDEYQAAKADLPDEQAEVYEEDKTGVAVRMFFPGGDNEMQLFEVQLKPNHVVQAHAHLEDELVYVTQGELIFGSRVCGVGSAVSVPGNTLYGFKAGDDGAAFLNFRTRLDFSNMTKDQFLAARAAKTAS